MFNRFFYNQFSEASIYDIEIDNGHSEDFDLDFNHPTVHDTLKKI